MTYATGGTVTASGGYRIHTFTSNGTLTVTEAGDAEVLVVAGGGGGGSRQGGGGGGAGGVLYNAALSLSASGHTITVGSGGSGGSSSGTEQGADGGNSSIGALAIAIGGGGGGAATTSDVSAAGRSGGSGGGAGRSSIARAGGSGTVGQGTSGGSNTTHNEYAGGGGGAGVAGENSTASSSGDGGNGLDLSAIFGTGVGENGWFGGGGGGGQNTTGATAVGSGGMGGGGDANGGLNTAADGSAGTANTGGGGGGATGGGATSNANGGAGGSGIVIVRYLLPTITVAPTVSYGDLTRVGPGNTATVSYTSVNAADYQVRTAASGGGTLVKAGSATGSITLAYDDSGISEGSNTLYLRVGSSSTEWSDDESFTLLVDNTAPVTFTATADPSTVSTRLYAVELTANDATSTGTDELFYEVRTAASGGGSLLTSGNRTSSGTAFTTAQFVDPTLVDGSNTRYVRVIDGAGNVREESFTVTGDDLPVPVIAETTYSRERPRAIDLITVEIYRPLGQYLSGSRAQVDYLDINPDVTALSFGSVLPGGWSEAMVGIANPNHDDRYGEPPRRPWLPREMAYGPFYHVEIRRHGRVLFAGRMGPKQRTYGRATGFSVQGYGMSATYDMYYRNTSSTTVSSGTLLRAMIAATAPHLKAAPDGDLWQDPGTAHAYNEFNRMYLGDVLDQVSTEGDSAGNIVDWAVFEDQVVQLRTRAIPQRADYLVPWSMVPDYVEDTSNMVGIASYERVSSGSPTGASTDYTNPDFAFDHGFQRGQMLQLGEISQTAAIAMTKAYLELHGKPVVSASIEAGPDDRLEAPGGREMPREGVRAGQWVQIEGMDEPLIIVSADYDAFTDVVRMQAGEFMPDFAMLLSTLEQDRRKRQRQIIPRYSGRAR